MATKTARRRGWLQVRCLPEEQAAADAIMAKVREQCPIATSADVVRVALRIGLQALSHKPGLVTVTRPLRLHSRGGAGARSS